MGYMSKWEVWSMVQYIKWGKDLQAKYDYFRDLKMDPKVLEAFETLLTILPEGWANKVMIAVVKMYQKVGPMEAEKWLKELLKMLKKFTF